MVIFPDPYSIVMILLLNVSEDLCLQMMARCGKDVGTLSCRKQLKEWSTGLRNEDLKCPIINMLFFTKKDNCSRGPTVFM